MKEGGYWSVDGSNASHSKPFSPSSLTPLSETTGFAQRSPDFAENNDSNWVHQQPPQQQQRHEQQPKNKSSVRNIMSIYVIVS